MSSKYSHLTVCTALGYHKSPLRPGPYRYGFISKVVINFLQAQLAKTHFNISNYQMVIYIAPRNMKRL